MAAVCCGIMIGCALVLSFLYLFKSTDLGAQAYTNIVQYNGINYTISQMWSQPDSCIFNINYTNGTLLWGYGWQPTRPSLANLFGDNPTNDYRWNLKDKADAIYDQEWSASNGIAWACCADVICV